jgi:hypothetical protein
LYDEPRPGAPRKISDEAIERVIVRTLEETPGGATHWSSRGMAKATGLGRTTIQQIWHAFRLQPHRSGTFKLSTDPLLIDKVRDIVGLCMQPPTHAVVFCVDEKSQTQALVCSRYAANGRFSFFHVEQTCMHWRSAVEDGLQVLCASTLAWSGLSPIRDPMINRLCAPQKFRCQRNGASEVV